MTYRLVTHGVSRQPRMNNSWDVNTLHPEKFILNLGFLCRRSFADYIPIMCLASLPAEKRTDCLHSSTFSMPRLGGAKASFAEWRKEWKLCTQGKRVVSVMRYFFFFKLKVCCEWELSKKRGIVFLACWFCLFCCILHIFGMVLPYIGQVGLELMSSPDSAFQMLGLQEWVSMMSSRKVNHSCWLTLEETKWTSQGQK